MQDTAKDIWEIQLMLYEILLTPYLHPTTPAQTFGVFKKHFPVQHIGFRCTMERTQAYLNACVIHNLCMEQGEDDYDDGGDYDQARRRRLFHGDDGNIAPDGFNGRKVREMNTDILLIRGMSSCDHSAYSSLEYSVTCLIFNAMFGISYRI